MYPSKFHLIVLLVLSFCLGCRGRWNTDCGPEWCADKMSPFKFYQHLLTSVADAEVIKFLRMLTFVPLEDIAELERSMQQPGYKPNTAQRLLASEVTCFVHGKHGLDQALNATKV